MIILSQEVSGMGSTIYSQTLKHPVFISYECEHCSQMNSFSQEIKGSGSAEVSNLSSNRNRQSKYNSVGPKAEQNLNPANPKGQVRTWPGGLLLDKIPSLFKMWLYAILANKQAFQTINQVFCPGYLDCFCFNFLADQ